MSITEWLPAGATAADIRAAIESFTDAEARELHYLWRELWARPEQLMPAGAWSNWIAMAGRGWGKTRTSAEAVRELVNQNPGCRIALIGPTAADVRDVMVEGESGLLSVFPAHDRPDYESSKRRVTFRNGSIAFLYSAEEPERLRGPQHHFAALDELAVYKDPAALWSNLKFGLRLGHAPRVIVTTTPRPSTFLKALISDTASVVSRGSTFDNAANLPQSVLSEFSRVYSGTRIGRQELEGELLEEAEGALWRRQQIEECRVKEAPELKRIAVAIDPATTSGENSDETGIIVAGVGYDEQGYVLDDGTMRGSPSEWANRAISMFDRWDADKVVAEANNGGDMIEQTLRTIRRNLPYEKVTASRGKTARAEPVAALYEQKKVHHAGAFRELEDEMCNFVPGKLTRSPNRADALVWALSFLMPFKVIHKGRALWI